MAIRKLWKEKKVPEDQKSIPLQAELQELSRLASVYQQIERIRKDHTISPIKKEYILIYLELAGLSSYKI